MFPAGAGPRQNAAMSESPAGFSCATVAPDAALRIARWFEAMRPEALDRLGEIYAEDARFKDPFHEVQGLGAIRAIYARMYEQLHEPRFVVTACLSGAGDARAPGEAQAFLAWEFRFASRARPQAPMLIRGGTHLRLDAQGRVTDHRDYWDAAEELYAKLPLVGALMRWLRRRVAG